MLVCYSHTPVEAPWIPPVKGSSDLTMIDDYFLQEIAEDSQGQSSVLDNDIDMFEGFTYEANGVLSTV